MKLIFGFDRACAWCLASIDKESSIDINYVIEPGIFSRYSMLSFYRLPYVAWIIQFLNFGIISRFLSIVNFFAFRIQVKDCNRKRWWRLSCAKLNHQLGFIVVPISVDSQSGALAKFFQIVHINLALRSDAFRDRLYGHCELIPFRS